MKWKCAWSVTLVCLAFGCSVAPSGDSGSAGALAPGQGDGEGVAREGAPDNPLPVPETVDGEGSNAPTAPMSVPHYVTLQLVAGPQLGADVNGYPTFAGDPNVEFSISALDEQNTATLLGSVATDLQGLTGVYLTEGRYNIHVNVDGEVVYQVYLTTVGNQLGAQSLDSELTIPDQLNENGVANVIFWRVTLCAPGHAMCSNDGIIDSGAAGDALYVCDDSGNWVDQTWVDPSCVDDNSQPVGCAVGADGNPACGYAF